MKREERKNSRRNIIIVILSILVCVFVGICSYLIYNYNKGTNFQNNKEYEKAVIYYEKIDFINKKVKEKEEECNYQRALELKENKEFEKSVRYFSNLLNYKDSCEQLKETQYQYAIDEYQNGNFAKAKELLENLKDYKTSKEYLNNIEILINLQGVWKYKEGLSNWVYTIDGWNICTYTKMLINEYIIGDEVYAKFDIGKKTIKIENQRLKIVFESGKTLDLNYNKEKNTITDNIGTYIKQDFLSVEKIKKIKEPAINMTKDEVLNSTWGKPKEINKTTTRYGTSEQWCYSDYRYIYFENGIVTSIQD